MAGRIVVGVDGSEGALAALRWALDEAERRGADLDVLHVWHEPYLIAAGGYAMPLAAQADLAEAAKAVLDRTLERADATGAHVRVEPILIQGSAARSLLDAAKHADLLVVGARGHGGFAGLLLGSVSQQCAQHAPCPVVVVPGTEQPHS